MSNTSIVFVCGALRSGSTLFHLMLDSHPRVNHPGEFDFMFDQVNGADSYPEVGVYKAWLKTNRIFQSKNLDANNTGSYVELIRSFTEQMRKKDNVLALNIHRNFHRVPGVFPDAKYIHLLRDPRDVARSSIGMIWAGNVYYGVDHWIQTERSWDELKKHVPNESICEITFENLIREPEKTLADVCNFLNLEYTEKMFDYEKGSTYVRPDASLVEQWKKKQTSRELKDVESKTHQMMLERGYMPTQDKPSQPDLFRRIYLSFQNKIYITRKNIERCGAPLYLSYKLCGKLHITLMDNYFREKLNEIDKKHLR